MQVCSVIDPCFSLFLSQKCGMSVADGQQFDSDHIFNNQLFYFFLKKHS